MARVSSSERQDMWRRNFEIVSGVVEVYSTCYVISELDRKTSTSMNSHKYMDAFDHDIVKRKADFQHKVAQVRKLMQELQLDSVVLSLSANFAWITSGARNYVFMATELWARGITPVVMLVAADERVDTIRHPLPTQKRVKNKAMLVICGLRAGLIASTTRLVYLTMTPNASIPDELLNLFAQAQ
eukprot:jgi/Phyca11/15296/fgenesh1_pg.PHYCAscaffold_12_\